MSETKKPERRLMPEKERELAHMLTGCTMLPGSAEKRFVGHMASADAITEKQLRYLYLVACRYRSQLRASEANAILWRAVADGIYPRWTDLDPVSAEQTPRSRDD